MFASSPWLALGLAAAVAAQQAGSIVQAGNTQVSAMMVRLFQQSWLFLSNLLHRCSLAIQKRSTF